MEWSKNNLNIEDTKNLEEVFNKLYINEIYNVPACVIIAFEWVDGLAGGEKTRKQLQLGKLKQNDEIWLFYDK